MTRARDLIQGLSYITERKSQKEIDFAIEKSLSSWDKVKLIELKGAVSTEAKNPLLVAKAKSQIGAIGGLAQKEIKEKDIGRVLTSMGIEEKS